MFGNDRVLLNISGHPLSEEAQDQADENGYKVISVKVPNVDPSDPASILDYIHTVFETISKSKKVISKIRTNDYIVIPPGMAILDSCMIAMLHGVSGCFPRQAWLIRNDEGKFLFNEEENGAISTRLDLQEIRIKYRDFRQP